MAGKLPLIVFSIAVASLWVSSLPEAHAVPAMFVFGDSTADVGNNNYLSGNKSKANHPYYGIDYAKSVPTGRFSNGFNGIDYLAIQLGFKQSPPPILSIRRQEQVFRGVSFASGGSGIFEATGKSACISMKNQIVFFKRTVDIFNNNMGQETAEYLLSKSIFFFSTANYDILEFFTRAGAQNATLNQQFVSTLAFNFKDHLEKMYNLGARKFVIVGVGNLGCAPKIRALNPNGDCVKEVNDLSEALNNATLAMLRDLSSTLQDMKYSLVNTYRVMSKVLAAPNSFGYEETKAACCGSGMLNVASGCDSNASVCPDRKKYVFWDGAHLTQAACQLVAQRAFTGSKEFATPINVEKLMKS